MRLADQRRCEASRAVGVAAVAQQEAGQLLAGLAEAPPRRQSRTDQITDCLMRLVRGPRARRPCGLIRQKL